MRIGSLAGLLAAFIAAGVPADSQSEESTNMTTLPKPRTKGHMSVEEALAGRRSVRAFVRGALTDEELSQILWAAQGITESNHGLRTAPSAGATYPLETHVVTADGVFHYLPAKHALEQTRKGDVRDELGLAALAQSWIRTAPAVLVFCAVPERTTRRYGPRGNMYIHMEAGHAAQNVQLQAVALGLGSVVVGAFRDEDVAKVIGVPKGEIPLYLIPVGRQAGAREP